MLEHKIVSRATEFLRAQRRRKRWKQAFSGMAALVVFCTTYALILPAITLEANVAETEPGFLLELEEAAATGEGEVLTVEEEGVALTAEDADLAVTALEDITLTVGESTPVTGAGGFSADTGHTWTVDPTGIVTLSGSNTYQETITADAEGTVTITHTYPKNKNEKTESETFTVTVTAAVTEEPDTGAEPEATTKELEAEETGCTVKVTGNTNTLPEGVSLVVEKMAEDNADYESYFAAMETGLEGVEVTAEAYDFLALYHIYLANADGSEYTPSGENINLKVTITYDSPLDADAIYVGHYKMTGSSVEDKGLSAAEITGSVSPGVKKISLNSNKNSITFHLQSFSVVTLAAPAAETAEDTSGSTGSGSTSTDTGYTYTPVTKTAPANNWQVVSGNYFASNATSGTVKEDAETYTYSSDYSVRYKKQAEATGNENEFRIHLTVEPESVDFASVIDTATLVASHNNSADIGGELNTNSGHSPLYSESYYATLAESAQANYSRVLVNIKFNGEIYSAVKYIDTTKIAAVNNGGVGIWDRDNGDGEVQKGEVTCISEKNTVSWETSPDSSYTNLIDLTSVDLANYYTITRYIVYPRTITDVMSGYVTYTNNVVYSAGSVTEPTAENGQTLTWDLSNVGEYTSDAKVKFTDPSGNPHVYFKNAYTLSYTVKLTNYESCGLDANGNPLLQNVVPTNGATNLSYRVDTVQEGKNSGTTTGTTQTTSFVVPTVRGLHYALNILKTSMDSAQPLGLSGAVFDLYASDGTTIIKSGLTTNANGNWTEAVTLGSGTYYLVETRPPDGFHALDHRIKITVNGGTMTAVNATTGAKYNTTVSGTTTTVTVPNSSGTVLPETGGPGATLYTMGGLTLMLGAACLLYNQTRRGKEDGVSP